MAPVGYYDLSTAGVPVHSTAFRPVTDEALRRNPFRVFTSLLRLELIADEAVRRQAEALLAARRIFTPALLAMLDAHDRAGGLTDAEARRFVAEALETFRWHATATVDAETYRAMHDAHRLVADVVCFRGPHINHLTPRTLDIDHVQAAMPGRGIAAKATIEGPPRRKCPILLRQTSFKALDEPIRFLGAAGGNQDGSHTARFGEIEQRGMALTAKGRALYDRLLDEGHARARGRPAADAPRVLEQAFAAFPDHLDALRREGLAFFRYRPGVPASDPTAAVRDMDFEALLSSGLLRCTPIVYEDFLPVSAAGIFQSNLGDAGRAEYGMSGSRGRFEAELGCATLDEMALYQAAQDRSLSASLTAIGAEGVIRQLAA